MKSELRFTLMVIGFYLLVCAAILITGIVLTDALLGSVLP